MTHDVNKHGQSMGSKGAKSRQRLLDAAIELISVEPAHRITPTAIARTARMPSQAFYRYFKDVDEVLLALSCEAGADMVEVLQALEGASPSVSPAEQAKHFIDAFSAYWDRHRAILTVRNYLADSAHPAFLTARQEAALPLVNAIAGRMRAAHLQTELDPAMAFARSVVIYSAIERMAARPATMRQHPRLLSIEALRQAETDILAILFSPPRA